MGIAAIGQRSFMIKLLANLSLSLIQLEPDSWGKKEEANVLTKMLLSSVICIHFRTSYSLQKKL